MLPIRLILILFRTRRLLALLVTAEAAIKVALRIQKYKKARREKRG